MSCKISVIVPCYNEEESLPLFYEAVSQALGGLGCSYQLYLVDDGSKDGTLELMKKLASGDERVKYISFSRNFGKEAAMYAGLCACDGDYVAVADADMQDPPALIPRMLEMLEEEDCDCVATRRVTRRGEPPIRSFFARRFYKLINAISSTEFISGTRDFRLMKRSMVDAVLSMSEYNRFSKGIFGWVGFKSKWIEYDNVERVAGVTKWSFWKLFKYALEGIMAFSTAPLALAAWGGIAMLLASLVMFICALALPSPGLILPLGALILLCGGLNMLLLGVLSLYFAKAYMETKGRPIFIAAERNDGK